MKHAEAEGTWEAAIRRIIWGIPITLVVIGLLIVLFAYLQPSFTATVLEVGETSYTTSRTMVRGHSSSYYEVELMVSFPNEQGTPESTTGQFGSTNLNAIPEIGDQLLISRGLSGMVTHPNRNLIGIGGGAATIGGLFLALYLLTMLRRRGNSQ